MTKTNLDRPHGPTIAYSRLANLIEAQGEHLDTMSTAFGRLLAGEELSAELLEAVATSHNEMQVALKLHLATREWAETTATDEEVLG